MSNWYNPGFDRFLDGRIDFVNDTINILIVSPSYTFNKTHEFVGDITNEVTNNSGTGYQRKTLASRSQVLDNANNKVVLDCDNPTYNDVDSPETWANAIIYKLVTDDLDSPLLCITGAGNLSWNGTTDLTLQVSTNGLIDISHTIS